MVITFMSVLIVIVITLLAFLVKVDSVIDVAHAKTNSMLLLLQKILLMSLTDMLFLLLMNLYEVGSLNIRTGFVFFLMQLTKQLFIPSIVNINDAFKIILQ